MKLSRRDFLKCIALLGSFAPFINTEKVRENLADFSYDQLKSISEIESIKPTDWGPYQLAGGYKDYYDIRLKNGTELYMHEGQIKERYGDILNCFLDASKPFNVYPAILND